MALQKNYSNGKKLYARISRIVLGKRWSPEIVVELYDILENEEMKLIHEMQFIIDRKNDDSLEFLPEKLDSKKVNPYSVGYNLLKKNVSLFSDFEDC